MNYLFEDIILFVISVTVFLLLVILSFSLVFNFYHAMNKRYWIYSGGDSTYYTDNYTEKNGCIYFENQYGDEVEQCGSYKISDQKGTK